MKMLLKGGEIIDPTGKLSGAADVLIEDGLINKIGKDLPEDGAEVIDVSGLKVAPGLVDIHVHLRDPGFEYKEDIESGLSAAAAGGFTSVVCMPNTKPAIDTKSVVKYINDKCEIAGLGRLFIAGAATKGREGNEIAEIGDMMQEGIVAVTDDGDTVANPQLMRRVLEYIKIFDIPYMCHAEEPHMAEGGIMHEGLVSTTLGIPAIPSQAESVIVARDIQLAELTGGRLHITHISAARAVDDVRNAKKQGLSVTCDVTPHHLTLLDETLETYDTTLKVNPPLRSKRHVDALIEGLKDGTIDAIASDHAPHAVHEKEASLNEAPFGLIGLETSLPVLITKLVKTGILTLEQLVAKLTLGPAQALGLDAGRIEEGGPADITVIDPDVEWTIDPSRFYSRGRNCPFGGWNVSGRAALTICSGRIISKDGVVNNG